jgi:hypothetical protein
MGQNAAPMLRPLFWFYKLRDAAMDKTTFAKGTTAEDLRILLDFWPLFMANVENFRQGISEDGDSLFDNAESFSWCHFYELPIKEHMVSALKGTAKNFDGLLDPHELLVWLQQLAGARSQASEIPKVVTQIEHYFDAMEVPSKELVEKIRPLLANTLGKLFSIHNTLRCLLYHGCFLNDLIDRLRAGDDKALFDAIRIDPTVIGCLTVGQRLSKAALLNDEGFFDDLKNAINGSAAKREQANFQQMRLVLEVLHEAGAVRLSDAQLHELFVEELKLYSGNSKGGGNTKALRKFADTYMKKNATT